MDGIEKICARITNDAQAEIGEIEAEAARQVEEIRIKCKEAAEQEREVLLARGRATAEERARRLNGLTALETKKETLAAKQELIAQVFAKAEESLCQMPADQYVSLLASLAINATKAGQAQIILSPKDKERYGKAVVQEANKRRKNGEFILAAKSRDIKGGLLLSLGDVEINCAFESLIQQLRGELTPQVAQILFTVK